MENLETELKIYIPWLRGNRNRTENEKRRRWYRSVAYGDGGGRGSGGCVGALGLELVVVALG